MHDLLYMSCEKKKESLINALGVEYWKRNILRLFLYYFANQKTFYKWIVEWETIAGSAGGKLTKIWNIL